MMFSYNKLINNISRIITLLIIFCVNSFGQTNITEEPRPKWIDNPPPGVFVGISHKFAEEADARADAISSAKREIIESLGAVISGEIVDQVIETSGQVESDNAYASSKVKVISKNIISVKPDQIYIEKWKEKTGLMKFKIEYRAFASVPFSKTKHKKFINDLINETKMVAEQGFAESMELAEMGKIFIAIEQLKLVNNNLKPLQELIGIAPTVKAKLDFFSDKVLAKITNLETGIRIEGLDYDQFTKIGEDLAKPLVLTIFCQDGDKKYPMSGLPVVFKILEGKATISSKTYTNQAGQANCNVRQVSSGGKLKIEATVDFPDQFKGESNKYLFEILSDNKIIIKIIETNLGQPVKISYLENALLERFNNAGFTILENNIFQEISEDEIKSESPQKIMETVKQSGTDLIILGTVSSGQTNKVSDKFIFSWARGTIRIFNVKEQNIAGNFILNNKGAGNSEEQAGVNAITKVSDQLITKTFKELGLE